MADEFLQIRKKQLPKPDWIKVRLPTQQQYFELKKLWIVKCRKV